MKLGSGEFGGVFLDTDTFEAIIGALNDEEKRRN